MTRAASRSRGGRATWGWWIVIAVAVILIADGAYLAAASGGASLFEQDTGVHPSEVQTAYPTVVEAMASRGRALGTTVAGLGLVALVAGWLGLRRRADAAWTIAATVLVVVAVQAASLLAAGAAMIGGVWAGYALVLLAGVALARPAPTGRR